MNQRRSSDVCWIIFPPNVETDEATSRPEASAGRQRCSWRWTFISLLTLSFFIWKTFSTRESKETFIQSFYWVSVWWNRHDDFRLLTLSYFLSQHQSLQISFLSVCITFITASVRPSSFCSRADAASVRFEQNSSCLNKQSADLRLSGEFQESHERTKSLLFW